MPSPVKLYVHVPFCHAKCSYCDFYSTPRAEMMEAYVDAAVAEWHHRRVDCVADTVYLGGGTPSSLPLPLLARLFEGIYDGQPLRECTIEVNPEDVSPEFVRFLLDHTPARRVSMGVQSLDDADLRAVGRRHSAADAVSALHTLREGGIENISADLIYGLPGQTLEGWERNLDALLALRPEHLSCYLLSYEPKTRLGIQLEQGKVEEASDELATAMYDTLCAHTRAAGYGHYEISNFALPGREAVHNSAYWTGDDYIGLGPGAHSLVGGERGFNPGNLKAYVAAYAPGGNRDFYVPEEENEDERFNDLLITALRTRSGLAPSRLAPFSPRIRRHFELAAAPLLKKGLLAQSADGSIAIPERNWLISNPILLDLIIT